MAAQSFPARLGLRLGILGSAASLAIAAPLANNDLSMAAHTDASRIGLYFDRTPAAEKVGVVVMGVESLSVYSSKVTVGNGIVMDATNRRLGVSDSTALFVPLATLHLSKNGNTGLRADTYSGTAAATAGAQFYRARGTFAAPTALQANDVMGFVGVYGYYTGGSSGFSNQSRAKIEFLAANTWSNTSQGASVGLWTTAIGSVAATERIRLYADGGMQIGGTGANWGTSPGNGVLTIMQNQRIAPLTGTVLQVVGSNNVKTRIEAVATQTAGGAQTAYSSFTGRTSRGPLANPTASLVDDIIVAISACGYGTSAWPTTNKGLIHINAAENWTDAAQGTYIGFDTTAAGGLVTSEKVRIYSNGGVQIGGTLSGSGPGAGVLLLGASTTSAASLRITPGVAPTTPVAGEVWISNSTNRLVAHINGASQSFIYGGTYTGALAFGVDTAGNLSYQTGLTVDVYAGTAQVALNGTSLARDVQRSSYQSNISWDPALDVTGASDWSVFRGVITSYNLHTSLASMRGGNFKAVCNPYQTPNAGLASLYGVDGIAEVGTGGSNTYTFGNIYGGKFTAMLGGSAGGTINVTAIYGSHISAVPNGVGLTINVTDAYGAYIENSIKGTLTNRYGAYVLSRNYGSAPNVSATTNQYGIRVDVQADAGATITTAYGLYLGLLGDASTITNEYGIYQASATAKNYFAGVVQSNTYFRNTPQEVTTAAATTAITSGRVKAIGTTAGQTLELPAGVAGTDIFIRNAASVSVTIAVTDGTIEGAATLTLNAGESAMCSRVGTDWTVFN